MGDRKRVYFHFEKHIGIGVRWAINWEYPFEIAISIPFVTLNIGFGKLRG